MAIVSTLEIRVYDTADGTLKRKWYPEYGTFGITCDDTHVYTIQSSAATVLRKFTHAGALVDTITLDYRAGDLCYFDGELYTGIIGTRTGTYTNKDVVVLNTSGVVQRTFTYSNPDPHDLNYRGIAVVETDDVILTATRSDVFGATVETFRFAAGQAKQWAQSMLGNAVGGLGVLAAEDTWYGVTSNGGGESYEYELNPAGSQPSVLNTYETMFYYVPQDIKPDQSADAVYIVIPQHLYAQTRTTDTTLWSHAFDYRYENLYRCVPAGDELFVLGLFAESSFPGDTSRKHLSYVIDAVTGQHHLAYVVQDAGDYLIRTVRGDAHTLGTPVDVTNGVSPALNILPNGTLSLAYAIEDHTTARLTSRDYGRTWS